MHEQDGSRGSQKIPTSVFSAWDALALEKLFWGKCVKRVNIFFSKHLLGPGVALWLSHDGAAVVSGSLDPLSLGGRALVVQLP